MGSGSKGGGAPEAPDYRSLIPLQTAANLKTFETMMGASRADQHTPFGSSTWSKTPVFDQAGFDAAMRQWETTPHLFKNAGDYQGAKPSRDAFQTFDWTNTQTLSPEQQQLYDANVGSQLQQSRMLSGLGGRVEDALAQPIDWSQIQGTLNPGEFSQEGADAAYNLATRYLVPEQDRTLKALESRLGEQGFVPGTPAYNDAIRQFSETKDRAMADARDRAVLTGHGMGKDIFQQNLAARKESLAELLTKRQFPLNELNALRSGTQVQNPTLQSTFATPQLTGVDLMGAAQQQYSNQIGQYNAQVGGDNAMLGLLGTLGGAAIGAPWMGTALSGLFGGGK